MMLEARGKEEDRKLLKHIYDIVYNEENKNIVFENNISLNDEKCKELMHEKRIKLEVDPFIIENLEKLAMEYEKDNLLNQSLFFYRLLYSITKVCTSC